MFDSENLRQSVSVPAVLIDSTINPLVNTPRPWRYAYRLWNNWEAGSDFCELAFQLGEITDV